MRLFLVHFWPKKSSFLMFKGPFTLRTFWMHIQCASKSVHISNRTSELKVINDGAYTYRVTCFPAYFPLLHHGDHRVACLLRSSVCLDAHAQSPLLENWNEWQELTRRSQEKERQPISTLVSSSVQSAPISSALSGYDSTPPHYHATMKAYPSHDFRIFAMNNNTIQFEYGSN